MEMDEFARVFKAARNAGKDPLTAFKDRLGYLPEDALCFVHDKKLEELGPDDFYLALLRGAQNPAVIVSFDARTAMPLSEVEETVARYANSIVEPMSEAGIIGNSVFSYGADCTVTFFIELFNCEEFPKEFLDTYYVPEGALEKLLLEAGCTPEVSASRGTH